MCLNQSDEEQKEDTCDTGSATVETECAIIESDKHTNSPPPETKENNEQQSQAQTVEEIVGHILMQNQEFQKLLEKQRTNSIINVRQQQRFNKHISADTSDDSDLENTNYIADNSVNNRISRIRAGHRERFVKTNNTWNSLSSSRDHQPTLQLLYDNLNKIENNKSVDSNSKNKVNLVQEKKALFEAFKRQSIVTESKVIKTALRIRENSTSRSEEVTTQPQIPKETESQVVENDKGATQNGECTNVAKQGITEPNKGFGNYDNLQHVWEGLQEEKDLDGNDSPTRPAVWLTKLCEGLPTSPQKCGSLPRSFQIHPNSTQNVTKSRFLQRDGKPMSERPFTIASDKPAEINLEDMERYASTCQPEGRIAKFPTSVSTSTSTSTFFCSLDDTLTDAYSEMHMSSTNTNIHPDHKIYRANTSGSTLFKNVLSKAGNRLQGLRNTMSTETLECSEELERTKYFRSLSTGKLKKKNKLKHSRESSSDVEELVGCAARGGSDLRIPLLYYKQGSSSLGARIAQSDYADPTVLFFESKRLGQLANNQSQAKEEKKEDEESIENRESETDSFYEKSFETIENYVDADVDDAFRDSAIFSDIDEVLVARPLSSQPSEDCTLFKSKVAPPVPAKKRAESITTLNPSGYNIITTKCKPNVAQKPDYLKIKSVFLKGQQELDCKVPMKSPVSENGMYQCSKNSLQSNYLRNNSEEKDDVSAGQSQAGWVRKIVGQLQGHIET